MTINIPASKMVDLVVKIDDLSNMLKNILKTADTTDDVVKNIKTDSVPVVPVNEMPSSPWAAKKAVSKTKDDPLANILMKYSNMYKDQKLLERDGSKTLSQVFTKDDLNAVNSIMTADINSAISKVFTPGDKVESVAFKSLRELCPSLAGKSDEDILLDFADKGWLEPFHGNYQYLEASKSMAGRISSCWVWDIDEFMNRTVKATIVDKYIDPKYGMKKPKKKILRYYNMSKGAGGVPELINGRS